MQRVPEAELMDDPVQAKAYARADFSEPHNRFVELFRQRCGALLTGTILDLGCGPGDICRRFAQAFGECRIHAVDASAPMLELGRRACRAAQLHHRIAFFQALLPDASLPRQHYPVILSNSLLHHLRQPDTLWNSIRRFGHQGTVVFVMDLLRPESVREVDRLVDLYAGSEPHILRRDFRNSLCAAYTPDEVTAQLKSHKLEHLDLEIVSDRHFVVSGLLQQVAEGACPGKHCAAPKTGQGGQLPGDSSASDT
jgi:ubiquinone/menaquinone biosynthesis C-methylase UbiE